MMKKNDEPRRFDETVTARQVLSRPSQYRPELVAWSRRVLGRCDERGCPFPAVRDDLCSSCWQRRHGEPPGVSRRSALAEAQTMRPVARGLSLPGNDAGRGEKWKGWFDLGP